MTHTSPRYPVRRAPELDGVQRRHPVVVVGGGLVGLTVALDLAQRGVGVVVLDEDDTVSTGSRAICFAQRTLEIYERLGLGERMLEKGITWNTGRVLFQDRELFSFNLLPQQGQKYPAFVNLQQYYVEEWLVDACQATGQVDLRWRNKVTSVRHHPDHAVVAVDSPDGAYSIEADWLLACDGARSPIRTQLALDFTGRVFRDRFLIADVVMTAPFPTERWFWFDPLFHRNQSALLHRQPDNVWRIDLQLGWDADPVEETRPERVKARVAAMLGPDIAFELEWVSLYTFRCRRLERFVHGRTIFVGDSAHQVSPFGARGGNGGVQDADNLAWKLAAVLHGEADQRLVDSYDVERIAAADENILHSTRATDFITPKSDAARAYRDAALLLAERFAFARPLVNSGRLSRPAVLPVEACGDSWTGYVVPGSPALDAPLAGSDFLIRHIGPGFTLLAFGDAPDVEGVAVLEVEDPVRPLARSRGGRRRIADPTGLVRTRYNAPAGAAVLFRPDGHVVASFRNPTAAAVAAVRDRVLARGRVAA